MFGHTAQVVKIFNENKDKDTSSQADEPMVTHASNVEMAPPKPQLSVLRRKPTDVEIQLKNLAEGSEKAWTTNKLLLKAVEELPKLWLN